MSVSAFPHAIINNFFRVLFAITGSFAAGDVTGPVTSGLIFNRDGSVDWNNDGSITARGSWWTGEPETEIGDDFEVRALSAGKVGTWTAAAAADDTWVDMSTARTWSVTRAGVGLKTTTATFEIRRASAGSALDSRSFTVSAEVII